MCMENKFGRLTVLYKKTKHIKNKAPIWICDCDCGTKNIEVNAYSLKKKNGGTKSCGCLLREKITEYGRGLIDISGKRYGSLVVECNSGVRKHNRILWLCNCDCGNSSLVYKSALTQDATVSCGCYKAKLASERKGDKHPSWKGGVILVTQKDRYTVEYKQWRKAVYHRDNYTCQVCKIRGSQLNAHHLESFHCNEHLRYEVSNGITLCEGCHERFHVMFSKENNTREQFEQFKKGGVL